MSENPYDILGVSRTASEAEIRKAYRNLALKYHPDKNKTPGASDQFRRVDEAYKVLGDKERRKKYDGIFKKDGAARNASAGSSARFKAGTNMDASFGFNAGCSSPGGANKPFPGPSGSAQSESFGSGTNSAGQWTKYRYGPGFSAPYSPSANPSSKFSTKYTAPGSTQKTQMKQNPAVEHNLDVTLFEVLHGCTKKMKVTRTVMSPDGRTSKREEKVLTINVKPGWKAGTKITFHREGDQIPGTIPADIVFIIRDKPHPLFKRVGADVHYQKRVSLEEATSHFRLTAPTLTGGRITVELGMDNINACIATKVVSGGGLPHHHNPKTRGDLDIRFDIANWPVLMTYARMLPHIYFYCSKCDYVVARKGHSH